MLRCRLHPSGLIALRSSGFTRSLLSFFPFFLLKNSFLRGGRRKRRKLKQQFFSLKT
jgi:hypothetical protein